MAASLIPEDEVDANTSSWVTEAGMATTSFLLAMCVWNIWVCQKSIEDAPQNLVVYHHFPCDSHELDDVRRKT